MVFEQVERPPGGSEKGYGGRCPQGATLYACVKSIQPKLDSADFYFATLHWGSARLSVAKAG